MKCKERRNEFQDISEAPCWWRAGRLARRDGRGRPSLHHMSFPVVLVTLRASHVVRKFSEIILAETGKNDWVVDKLP
jgi:hypothetical protein